MREVNRHLGRSALVAVVVALAACSGGSDDDRAPVGEAAPNVVQPGAPGEATRRLTPEDVAAIEATPSTQGDVRFMQTMIRHHAQALRMTALVPARSKRKDVALLAERMDISQKTEIEQMRKWLATRGKPASVMHGAHGMGQMPMMPGMITEPELKQLAAARGRAFDRLFLRFMIRHHEGAVTMVSDLYAGGGGGESEIDAFARHVDADQQIEIARMRTILDRLAAARE